MGKAILWGLTGTAAAVAVLALGYAAGRPAAGDADGDPQVIALSADGAMLDRQAVGTVIRDYLLQNPDLLVDMQTVLEERQKEEQRLAHLKVIEESHGDIFNAAYDGVVGNPNGKITIVEFYDYNCGFCKRAQQDMQALTAENPNLRFVLKEFPILGPNSQKAHVVSMAFRALMPEKFGEFHNQLLGGQGRAGEASAIKIALSLGVDEGKLREEMKNPAIVDAFTKTYDLANRLAISGTPSYVVGSEVVYGALGKDVLGEKIASVEAACAGQTC